ncbi:leucyl/phenylalanyl-tRNA--protein transferase [Salegentibacter sp. HM20]
MKDAHFYENFPPVHLANEDGLLAIGGELSERRLLDAYSRGIFPWYSEDQPVLWWSPDPRMVLFPEDLKISKSMKQVLRNHPYRISFDEAFEKVIRNCAEIPRQGQDGTWITEEMIAAYLKLHKNGVARSVEIWEGELLIAGLYGIWLADNKVFCGESMFTRRNNASKLAFIKMIEFYKNKGLKLVDCQIYTPHLESLGAKEISRENFLKFLD